MFDIDNILLLVLISGIIYYTYTQISRITQRLEVIEAQVFKDLSPNDIKQSGGSSTSLFDNFSNINNILGMMSPEKLSQTKFSDENNNDKSDKLDDLNESDDDSDFENINDDDDDDDNDNDDDDDDDDDNIEDEANDVLDEANNVLDEANDVLDDINAEEDSSTNNVSELENTNITERVLTDPYNVSDDVDNEPNPALEHLEDIIKSSVNAAELKLLDPPKVLKKRGRKKKE